jgi:NAD+ diphosphatase
LHYVGSQPWPFPGSLMLGFHAWTSAVEIEVDGMEIAEADWFSRELLGQEAASGRIQLPPAISIARRLIERWYGEPLPGSWLRT